MKKIGLFSVLLAAGLGGSQVLPDLLGPWLPAASEVIGFLTMACLSFIMIHVGYEFELDKRKLGAYGWDYVVAMTTAGFPWLFAALYFVFVMMPPELRSSGAAWTEVLLAGRFAAPTATGVLFAMLAAAGLSATWMFRKTRVLVIFDDLDTVLLMIPLKILMVGLAWQLGVVVAVMVVLLWVAWRWLHAVDIPVSWPWVAGYAILIAGVSEALYWGTKTVEADVPIHLEVLLPAFVLGCIMRRPPQTDPHADDPREGHQEGPESPAEQRVSTAISAAFMLLVGLSMPLLTGESPARPESAPPQTVTAGMEPLGAGAVLLHTLAITLLINIGKMFPALCYRREAHWKERLAVAIGMCPRGEVGAGIILLSLEYGIGGPIVSVAVLSLALNLLLTPAFVLAVSSLVRASARSAGGNTGPRGDVSAGVRGRGTDS
ncbi:MAG: sodium:proton antiporter [Bacteroidota bacterium]